MNPLQRYLVDKVRIGMKTNKIRQSDIAIDVGFSEKHVSQMLTGKTGGTLDAWHAVLKSAGVDNYWGDE